MIRLAPSVFLIQAGTPLPSLADGAMVLAEIPSRAFGDGSHPTTRLCAGAVHFLCRQNKPEAVLDVGTGTGVLARVARLLGVRFVVGTDIDPEALQAAQANCALDSTLPPIEIADHMPDHRGDRFNLVVANILEGPLKELAPALSRALAPGGTLMVSGFTRLQVPSLRLAFEAQGLAFESEATLEGWVLLTFHAPLVSRNSAAVPFGV